MSSVLLTETIATLRSQKDLAEKAMVQVSDERLHTPLHPETNSIAVIVKHMAGNMFSRWSDFLNSDGEKPDRDRDGEFVDTFKGRDEMMQRWEAGWRCLFDALEPLSDADLAREVKIRGEPHTVAKAILRQVSHYGYHVGQIVMIARILCEGEWNVLTIPRGGSKQFNERMKEVR